MVKAMACTNKFKPNLVFVTVRVTLIHIIHCHDTGSDGAKAGSEDKLGRYGPYGAVSFSGPLKWLVVSTLLPHIYPTQSLQGGPEI